MKISSLRRKARYILLSVTAAVISVAISSCAENAVTYRFIGDSIIVRWDLQNSFPILVTENSGLSGSGIDYLKEFAGRCVGEQVVVNCGSNDSWNFSTPQAAADYAVDYVGTLGKLGADKVYVFSITPRRYESDEEQLNANIRLMNNAIAAEVAEHPELPIVYIDVYDCFLDSDGKFNLNLTYDGLHLNPAGYEILTKELNKHIL